MVLCFGPSLLLTLRYNTFYRPTHYCDSAGCWLRALSCGSPVSKPAFNISSGAIEADTNCLQTSTDVHKYLNALHFVVD